MSRFLKVSVIGLIWVVFPSSQVKSAWQDQWKDLLARARQEGRVVLATSVGSPEFRQAVSTTFPKRFGINVDVRPLGGAESTAIVGRECAVGRATMDVLLGGNSEVITLLPKGCLSPVKPKLVLPDVVDPQNWRGGFLKWTDPEGQYILQTAEFASGNLFINTAHIKPLDVTSSKDLLKPQYRGKIVSHDPRRSGTGQGKAAYLLTVLGEDYTRSLYGDQKVVFSSDERQIADWVARGIYWIGFGAEDKVVQALRQEGLPIAPIKLEDAPGYLSGDSSMIKLLKDAPNPNAAAILVNWLASKEGQEIFTRFVGRPSRRSDVYEKVPEWSVPQAGVKYLDTMDYEYYSKRRREVVKILIKLLGR